MSPEFLAIVAVLVLVIGGAIGFKMVRRGSFPTAALLGALLLAGAGGVLTGLADQTERSDRIPVSAEASSEGRPNTYENEYTVGGSLRSILSVEVNSKNEVGVSVGGRIPLGAAELSAEMRRKRVPYLTLVLGATSCHYRLTRRPFSVELPPALTTGSKITYDGGGNVIVEIDAQEATKFAERACR